MPLCPHCNAEICIRKLPHQGLFKTHRICPACGGAFTVDRATKQRQAAFIVLALASLVLTLLMFYRDPGWWPPAVASYLLLAILIYWGNRKVCFVPHELR